MDSFYLIISCVAIVLLILLLTVVGLMMKNKNAVDVYPPYQSQCPDYWIPNTDGSCTPNSSINRLSNNATYNPTNVAEVQLLNNIIATNVSGSGNSAVWNFDFTGNTICDNKTWALAHSIQWDGVTNSSNC